MSNIITYCHNLLLIPLVIPLSVQNCGNSTVGLHHSKNTTYFFGGIFSTHIKNGSVYILDEASILLVSSMMFAIQEINERKDILPGIEIGYEIRDSRNDVLCACEHALELLLTKKNSVLVGVVGPDSSSLSVAVSTMLLSDYVPQVSYSSTSISLSQRFVYRNFFRTVPSDVYQAKALMDLIEHFQWTYISLFTSDDEYGRFGRDEILKAATEKNICFSVVQTISSILLEDEVGGILETIKRHSSVVILWCESESAAMIISQSVARGLKYITWIGSETWKKELLRYSNINITHNILFLQLKDYPINVLDNKIFNAKKKSQVNCDNPWYKELLRKYATNDSVCIPNLAASLPKGYTSQVYSAVYALAYGLHKYLNCSFEKCYTPYNSIDYQLLYNYSINTSFTVPNSNYTIRFDENGEILFPAYQYMFVDQKGFIQFGTWEYNPTNVIINQDIIAWKNNLKPKSVCSLPCLPGTYRVNSTSSKCCWICVPCPRGSVSHAINQYECTKCSLSSIENLNQTQCNDLYEISLNVFSAEGIIIIVGSLLGVFCTLFVLIFFFKYWNNPVIKSSNKEMSCIQVFSLKLLFCISFFYFWKPTPTLCMFRVTLFGFLLFTFLAFVTVKTYRLLYVFNCKFTKASKFLDNKFQITFTFSIVLMQTIVVVILHVCYPTSLKIVPNYIKKQFFLICKDENPVIWISALFFFLLAVVNGCMAYRARNLPGNFKETQSILYGMLIVIILWVSYIPIHFSVNPHESTVVFLFINIVACYSMLFILYGKRVFYIMFYPSLSSVEFFYDNSAQKVIHNFVERVSQADGTTINVVRSVVMYDKNVLSKTIF
ncbi:extracellular calcium-sensing receptor isoform X1 [Hydra vulgaris]|uniref:extracellular calcium-sensing receptor isoform X1 n=1 Tax=Hydra vulgaris TaxID=6087 RepID=UPI001F5F3B4F|nr:extracellular calcium-sensing receptor-like isoform X1 [Hydra vulgaris]